MILCACSVSRQTFQNPDSQEHFTSTPITDNSPFPFSTTSINFITITPSPVTGLIDPTITPTMLTLSSTGTLNSGDWKELPVIPVISNNVRKIYSFGQELGNNPRAFSKVGDCESRTTWFLTDFDMGSKYYTLGSYSVLQQVIDYFSGSFGRLSLVAKPGFTAASVLTPIWADPKQCEKNESPLACEYRVHRPSFAIITLGTNDTNHPETFASNMRKVIEYSVDHGVIPVLATKADNREGNDQINITIASLAQEYDIPLWNFWLAVQPLPAHGLQEDGAHLTWSPNNFSDPEVMKRAWPMRNLTALQVLDALWKGVSQ